MSGERILIIDRNIESRSWLIEAVMRPAGYVTAEVSSLDDAHVKITDFNPHVVVLDAQISPNPDNVLAFLTEYEVWLPVVLIAHRRLSDEILAALDHGACDVLVKPFDPARLAKSVIRALRANRAIHQRDALREQTERQTQEFNALYTVGKEVTGSFDLEAILSLVVTTAVNLTRAEEGTLMLLDSDTGDLFTRPINESCTLTRSWRASGSAKLRLARR